MRKFVVSLTLLVLAGFLISGCEPVDVTVSPVATVAAPVAGPMPVQAGLPQLELSGTGIAAIVAFLLSIALQYTAFSTWWNTLTYKREVLAGVGLLVAWGLVGLHYLGVVDMRLGAFGWLVVRRVFEAWLAFAGAGQLMYTAQHAAERWLKGHDAQGA